MSYKNKLQEYFQKKGIPLPIYDAKLCESGWIGSVTINVNNKKIKFKGDIKNKKIESQQSACIKTLEYLKVDNSTQEKNIDDDKNKYIYNNKLTNQNIIFIDIENTQKYKYIKPKNYIFGFISTNSYMYKKLNEIEKYMDTYVYEGTEKNGSDILMSIIVAKNIPHIQKFNNKITIITNDNYAKCIKNILEKDNIFCNVEKDLFLE
jgi:hypothetical protein